MSNTATPQAQYLIVPSRIGRNRSPKPLLVGGRSPRFARAGARDRAPR